MFAKANTLRQAGCRSSEASRLRPHGKPDVYKRQVYIPVPCEESCPVKAISKDEHGIEHIDESKCIYCGKCMNACPFGAISVSYTHL